MGKFNTDRAILINTPLGEDVFAVLSFDGSEYICKLYSFNLQLASRFGDITFDQMGGKNVTVSIRSMDGAEHFFNGIIVAFEPQGRQTISGFRVFNARMVPAVWVLNQWIDCRIFQYKSIPDIIETVLDQASLNNSKGMHQKIDFRMDLSLNYGIKEYCEQNNEADFAFISRLCENEGIFYYFQHENGRHILVFTDDKSRINGFKSGGIRTVTFRCALDRQRQPESNHLKNCILV